jgi:dienelactone hydrolase
MKIFTSTFLVFFAAAHLFGQIYTGPIARPLSGYGADGTHAVGVESFPNPYFPTEDIKIYHPSDIATSVPTLFYSHAFTANFPVTVLGLLNFAAKKGYAIVFVPYQTVGVSVSDRYENLLEGFRKAARDYPNIIDTTKVGFLGHSFGGGASFATAYACFTENNWGSNGRFVHSSAPWYLFNISQSELNSFPSDTKLIVEVYDDDNVNDHRIAADAFINIGISDAEKDFIKVKADTVSGYIYATGHDLPTNYSNYDALDYYAYYRLIDALADYAFNGSLAGKDVALGNGSPNQISMPSGMRSLEQTDSPTVAYPESNYGFPCSSIGNPRNDYCEFVLSHEEFEIDQQGITFYPNPVNDVLTIDVQDLKDFEIGIYNNLGQCLLMRQAQNQIDVSNLPNGIYYMLTKQGLHNYSSKLIKQ